MTNHLDVFKPFKEKYGDNHFVFSFELLDMFNRIIYGRLTNEEYFEL